MGQELVSTQALYDPKDGWETVENGVIAGEYSAFTLNSAGVALRQGQMLQERLAAAETQLGVST